MIHENLHVNNIPSNVCAHRGVIQLAAVNAYVHCHVHHFAVMQVFKLKMN